MLCLPFLQSSGRGWKHCVKVNTHLHFQSSHMTMKGTAYAVVGGLLDLQNMDPGLNIRVYECYLPGMKGLYIHSS